jgi:nitric oxide reductase activation protein
MKFLVFADTKIDSFVHMQLIDLARSLSKVEKMDVSFSYHSYLERQSGVTHVSQFWNPYPREIQLEGWKSDVYLRSYGTQFYTDNDVIWNTLHELKSHPHREFLKQVLLFSEDFRLEEICKSNRPGMTHAFKLRKETFQVHYNREYRKHIQQKRELDALFCHIILLANKRFVAVPQQTQPLYQELRPLLTQLTTATSTRDIANIVFQMADITKRHPEFLDMKTAYRSFSDRPKLVDATNEEQTFDNLTRNNETKTKKTITKDEDKEEKEDEQEKESHSSWHDETSDPQDSFLQMDLDQGTNTDLLGEAAREAESGDAVFGSVQTSAQSTDKNDFNTQNEQEAETDSNQTGSDSTNHYPYGEVNKNVTEHLLPAKPATPEEFAQYERFEQEIAPFVIQLKQNFLKTMEHKRTSPREDLHFGRLGKKLTRLVTDKNPRLFRKKQESQHELDTTFTLLVDCSASMFNKMEETQKGIVLFHETLKALRIPHSVVGFWEDAADATTNNQPNYFHEVISYRNSLHQPGASIMQLEPQEDNRDGYSIRRMGEELAKRPEQQKILLVFSDGEPAAFDYESHGVLDTHEAVTRTRKLGIETIGMYIANGEITEEEEKLMQNIYGPQNVVVPSAAELVDYLMPVLRKLLFKSI